MELLKAVTHYTIKITGEELLLLRKAMAKHNGGYALFVELADLCDKEGLKK